MAKSLIITEKPSVARDVVEALGGFTSQKDDSYWESDRYLCTFSVGHVLELLEPEEIDPVYKRWELANLPILPSEFKLKPKQGQSERIRTIKQLMLRADVDEIINACDAGREGELIFRELVKFVGSSKPIRRLWLQSMTKDAIRHGFANLQDGRDFEGLAAAAECRSLADWLIGMNASRALTVRLRSRSQKGAWSAGRVQTPTLALLVDRELEILRHLPEPYWRVNATFSAAGHSYEGGWFDPQFKADEQKPQLKSDRIFDEANALAIVELIKGKTGAASETRKPSREAAPPLFDLTSLQREANRRFGWSAARALSAAQRCYETHKVLTYPRTDSRCLPEDYRPEVDKVLLSLRSLPDYQKSAAHLIANGRQNENKVFNNAGVSDHFAIIPTGQIPRGLKGDDERLFDLVTRRFLGAFFPPAVWEQVDRLTVVLGHHFSTKARTLKEPGWRSCLDQAADADGSKGLPPLVASESAAEGVPAKVNDAAVESEKTKPPPRITEGRLLSLMENAGKSIEDEDLAAMLHEKGLGTPATRADTIENLKAKSYVDATLRPTVKGMRLIDLLHRINAGRLTSAELTGELELHLREVEQGNRQPGDFMGEIADYAREVVEATRSFEYDAIFPNEQPLGLCPCEKKRPVYERAWFYRCQEDPAEIEADNDCPFRIWKDKSGRYLDRQTVTNLLEKGQTGEVDGFADRRGRTYKGILVIEGKEVLLRPIAGSESGEALVPAAVEFEINPEPLGPCPFPDCENCQVIETPTDFICQTRKARLDAGESRPKGFILPRMVCKREITRAEAIEYLQNKTTSLIEDFISRFGRPFKAKLVFDPKTGRHKFEFPPREGGAKGRGRWGRKKAADSADSADSVNSAENAETPATKKVARKSVKKAAGDTADGAPKTAKTKARKAPAKKRSESVRARKST